MGAEPGRSGKVARTLEGTERSDLDGAEELFREVLAAQRETLGDRNPGTWESIGNLGSLRSSASCTVPSGSATRSLASGAY